ncbi:hypothetical protein Micbo1qcDRAFT_170077, partial [Microdochium bolleyi]
MRSMIIIADGYKFQVKKDATPPSTWRRCFAPVRYDPYTFKKIQDWYEFFYEPEPDILDQKWGYVNRERKAWKEAFWDVRQQTLRELIDMSDFF